MTPAKRCPARMALVMGAILAGGVVAEACTPSSGVGGGGGGDAAVAASGGRVAGASGGSIGTGGAGSGGAAAGGGASGGAVAASGGAAVAGRAGGTGGAIATGGASSTTDGGSSDGAPDASSMDGPSPTPSAGCGMTASDAPGTFVAHTIDVGGVAREYFVRLPPMYDAARAYPVVFVWHGAGGTGKTNNVPIQNSSGANAIVVGGTALVNATEMRTQWQFNNATSPDVAFFDAMVIELSAHYCVDRARLFSAGFSSGAWFSNLLGCVRGNVMRGYGVVAGGTPGGGRITCTPGGIAAWFLHDENDTENVIAGNITTRTRLLTANGCGTTTMPDTPAPCVRYDGCRAGVPLVWCQTTGAGHSVQSTISGPGMWRFFSSL